MSNSGYHSTQVRTSWRVQQCILRVTREPQLKQPITEPRPGRSRTSAVSVNLFRRVLCPSIYSQPSRERCVVSNNRRQLSPFSGAHNALAVMILSTHTRLVNCEIEFGSVPVIEHQLTSRFLPVCSHNKGDARAQVVDSDTACSSRHITNS